MAMINFPKDHKRKSRSEFNQFRVVARCTTCGEIFLDVPLGDFLEKHSWDAEMPDRWFVEAAKHWLLNKEHVIIFEAEGLPEGLDFPSNLSGLFEYWRSEKIIEWGSEENMLREIERYLKNCEVEI